MSAIKVHIYDNEILKNSVNVSSGNWSKSLSLSAGSHGMRARSEDLAGNISSYSSYRRIRTGATETPTVYLQASDDSGQSSSDKVTNVNQPNFRIMLNLTAPSGAVNVAQSSVSEIRLYKKTGASTYDHLGTDNSPEFDSASEYEAYVTPGSPLADGQHEICATWKDAAGNESAKGTVITITVDTVAPNAPVISSVDDGQVFVGTSINIAGTAS